jgi:4-amino-4-deoxy-L-arabinose transferase-like glycosyltransferase
MLQANRVLMLGFSFSLLYVIWLLAKDLYGAQIGYYAAFFSIFSFQLWGWSAQVSSHIPAAFFICLSVLFLWRALKQQRNLLFFLSGLSIGLAFMFRFDSLVYIVPLIAFTLYQRGEKCLLTLFFGLCISVAIHGFVDHMSWGGFLHSPIAFFQQNLVAGKSADFGIGHPLFYIGTLCLNIGCLFTIQYWFDKKRETVYILSMLLFPLFIFSLIPHKEMRFIISLLPFFFIISAKGLDRFAQLMGRKAVIVVMLAAIIGSSLIVIDQCQRMPRLGVLNWVGSQDDSTGVASEINWFIAGGYSGLHKRIPIVEIATQSRHPNLELVNCTSLYPENFDFQCMPWDEVLKEPRINYLILDEKTEKPQMISRKYERIIIIDNKEVYRRLADEY